MLPIQSPDNLFHDGVPGGELGTIVSAAWLGGVQAEILNVQQASGLVPSNVNNQLLRATMTCLLPGVALPVQNIGPIWHDDYNSVMTWQTFNANGAAYVGYASVLVGNLLQDTQPTPRVGYVKSGTQNLSRTTYAALRAWAQHNGLMIAVGSWAAGGLLVADNLDGTTFRVYDVRGEFLRNWDDGRGTDVGRLFGSYQGDAIRNIQASLTAFTINGGGGVVIPSGATGALSIVNSGTNLSATASNSGNVSNYGLQFNASNVVPTAVENRSRNTALLASVKF